MRALLCASLAIIAASACSPAPKERVVNVVSEPDGRLLLDGKPITPEGIAHMMNENPSLQVVIKQAPGSRVDHAKKFRFIFTPRH